jgi:hypothetical protein
MRAKQKFNRSGDITICRPELTICPNFGIQDLIVHMSNVQKQIRQDGANDAPYAKGNSALNRVICDWRTWIAVLDLRLKK